uniref:Ferric reductase NAD binding domain-containing protein n=1 Tax=Nelumbo nucifera TaxID=4432 RepID=A0A822YID2_NELNU|nr:TPA_asm: hypothetical protein HUJ06_011191 [Nelumbo nucifera]
MISTVKDGLNNIKQQNDVDEGAVEAGSKANKKKPFATKRAYFDWVTREQGSFEWFRGILNVTTLIHIKFVFLLGIICLITL